MCHTQTSEGADMQYTWVYMYSVCHRVHENIESDSIRQSLHNAVDDHVFVQQVLLDTA
jgi:hypothetical protein